MNFNIKFMNLKKLGISCDEGNIILSKRFLPPLLFCLFFFVFLMSSGGHIMTPDGLLTFVMTENFVKNGSLTLNVDSSVTRQTGWGVNYTIEDLVKKRAVMEYKKGLNNEMTKEEFVKDYFEKTDLRSVEANRYAVLPLIAVPLYLIAESIGINPLNFVPLFLNSIIIAITAVVIFLLGKEIFNSERIGVALSLIFGFTSYIWPYTNGMLARPLAIMFMMIFIYFIIKNKKEERFFYPILAGVSLMLMGISQGGLYFAMPLLLIYGLFELRKNRKALTVFVIAVVLLILVQLYINDYRYGSPFDITGHGSVLEGRGLGTASKENPLIPRSTFDGIYGFIISPDHSIIVYFPLFLLFPLGCYCMFKKDRPLGLLIIFLFIFVYLSIAATSTSVLGEGGKWNSINAIWGPHRYLLPLIPIITISIGAIISKFQNWKMKMTVFVLSAVGFFVNLLGSLVFWRLAFNYGLVQEGLRQVDSWNKIMTWDPQYSLVALSMKVLENNYLNFKGEFVYYVSMGLADCKYDSFLFCEYGVLGIVLIVILIVVIAYLIVLTLNSQPKLAKLS